MTQIVEKGKPTVDKDAEAKVIEERTKQLEEEAKQLEEEAKRIKLELVAQEIIDPHIIASCIAFVDELDDLKDKKPQGWHAEKKPGNPHFSEWFTASAGSLTKTSGEKVTTGTEGQWLYIQVGRSADIKDPQKGKLTSLTIQGGKNEKQDFYLWYNERSYIKLQTGNNPLKLKQLSIESTDEETAAFKESARKDMEIVNGLLQKTMNHLIMIAKDPSLGTVCLQEKVKPAVVEPEKAG